MTAGWLIAAGVAAAFAAFGAWMDLCDGWHFWRTRAIRMSGAGRAYEFDQRCARCGTERVWKRRV